MPKINILDSNVYNQIAAGEVVENPASIVKELVENSIDAVAQNITIMIDEGGIKSINVIDDGEGMDADDLFKSILPHSTSKVKSAEDLKTISTLGFRGEALASIASVSEVDIKSKHFQSDVAHGLKVKGGEIIENSVVPLNKGTSVTISKLFYNTPARYKFLKTPKSEEHNITAAVADIILANPNTAFRYYIDKKLLYCSAGEGLKESIKSVYDKSLTDNLMEIFFEDKPYIINGFIAKPDSEAIKFNRNYQTIIINGRVIKDYTLSAVVQNAYAEKLMKRTFPVFILDIVMPFDMVDVNVHPGKKEVRYAKNCKIKSAVYNAIKATLSKITQQIEHNISFLKSNKKDEPENKDVSLKNLIFDEVAIAGNKSRDKEDADEINQKLEYLSKTSPKLAEHITKLKEESFTVEKAVSGYTIIGQLFNTYIVLEHNDNMYMIDQHAAHERILYDNYISKLKQKPVDIQDLMIPYLYEGNNNYQIILQNKELLAQMGFEIEEFGNNLIKVTALPLQFSDINIDAFMNDVTQSLVDITSLENIDYIKDTIAKKACKNAIKGGKSLSEDNIKYIMEKFFYDNIPLQCPHGRPIIIKLTKSQIEKMFRRIV